MKNAALASLLFALVGCGGGGGGSTTPPNLPTPTPTPTPAARLYAAGDAVPSNAIAYFTAPFTAASLPAASIATASGGEIAGVAVDNSGNVVASDEFKNTITGYTRPNPTTTTAFTLGTSFEPAGIAFDASGKFYVANYTGNAIDVLSTPLSATSTITPLVTNGVSAPSAICFDTAQNLYVVNGPAGTIEAYAAPYPYAGTPVQVSVGVGNVFDCAYDATTNQLIVSHSNFATGNVYIYNLPLTAASTAAATIALTTTSPTDVAADKAGNLYVGVDLPGIEVFAPPFTSASLPTLTISPTANAINAMAFGT
jgi:hypothetical protein